VTALEMRLEMIVKWLKNSRPKVKESKTELCLLHCNDTRTIYISIQNTKNQWMYWGSPSTPNLIQVSSTIKKSNKALYTLNLASSTTPVRKTLLFRNCYSILYYIAEIWLISTLLLDYKQQLSTSANAICSCIPLGN
jgi:hypothetical protein